MLMMTTCTYSSVWNTAKMKTKFSEAPPPRTVMWRQLPHCSYFPLLHEQKEPMLRDPVCFMQHDISKGISPCCMSKWNRCCSTRFASCNMVFLRAFPSVAWAKGTGNIPVCFVQHGISKGISPCCMSTCKWRCYTTRFVSCNMTFLRAFPHVAWAKLM